MKDEIITTIDEEGNEVSFKLMDVVNVDDHDYALLLPEGTDENEDDAELILMRLIRDGEEYTFETIEDEDEFDLVAQAIIDDANDNGED